MGKIRVQSSFAKQGGVYLIIYAHYVSIYDIYNIEKYESGNFKCLRVWLDTKM